MEVPIVPSQENVFCVQPIAVHGSPTDMFVRSIATSVFFTQVGVNLGFGAPDGTSLSSAPHQVQTALAQWLLVYAAIDDIQGGKCQYNHVAVPGTSRLANTNAQFMEGHTMNTLAEELAQDCLIPSPQALLAYLSMWYGRGVASLASLAPLASTTGVPSSEGAHKACKSLSAAALYIPSHAQKDTLVWRLYRVGCKLDEATVLQRLNVIWSPLLTVRVGHEISSGPPRVRMLVGDSTRTSRFVPPAADALGDADTAASYVDFPAVMVINPEDSKCTYGCPGNLWVVKLLRLNRHEPCAYYPVLSREGQVDATAPYEGRAVLSTVRELVAAVRKRDGAAHSATMQQVATVRTATWSLYPHCPKTLMSRQVNAAFREYYGAVPQMQRELEPASSSASVAAGAGGTSAGVPALPARTPASADAETRPATQTSALPEKIVPHAHEALLLWPGRNMVKRYPGQRSVKGALLLPFLPDVFMSLKPQMREVFAFLRKYEMTRRTDQRGAATIYELKPGGKRVPVLELRKTTIRETPASEGYVTYLGNVSERYGTSMPRRAEDSAEVLLCGTGVWGALFMREDLLSISLCKDDACRAALATLYSMHCAGVDVDIGSSLSAAQQLAAVQLAAGPERSVLSSADAASWPLGCVACLVFQDGDLDVAIEALNVIDACIRHKDSYTSVAEVRHGTKTKLVIGNCCLPTETSRESAFKAIEELVPATDGSGFMVVHHFKPFTVPLRDVVAWSEPMLRCAIFSTVQLAVTAIAGPSRQKALEVIKNSFDAKFNHRALQEVCLCNALELNFQVSKIQTVQPVATTSTFASTQQVGSASTVTLT